MRYVPTTEVSCAAGSNNNFLTLKAPITIKAVFSRLLKVSMASSVDPYQFASMLEFARLNVRQLFVADDFSRCIFFLVQGTQIVLRRSTLSTLKLKTKETAGSY